MTDIDYGFVILCPERNLGGLIATVRSVARLFSKECLCVLPKGVTKKELAEFAEACPTVKGKDTYTSLINIGLKKSKSTWNFIVMAGSTFRYQFYRKYSYFLTDDKDILFPIVDGHTNFVDATINGILLNRDAIQEVGEFEDIELPLSKVTWALKAINKGYRFKAIMGARVF